MKSYNDKIAPKKNIEFVHMSFDETPEDALEWAKKESFPWPTVLFKNTKEVLFGDFEVKGIPTYILVDKDGNELLRGHKSKPIFKKIESL